MKTELTVCLSHDVDRMHKSFQYYTHFLRRAGRGDLSGALYQIRSLALGDTYWCFEKILDLEASYGVKSSFFFLNETYPFNPIRLESWRLSLGYYDIFKAEVAKMIRLLDSRGFEIGLHGSYRSYLDLNLLKKEKADLESILGHPVKGVRQHYLNLNEETWSLQRRAGFLYDASFGYRDRVGFRDGVLRPFPLDSQNDFFVVPLPIMDACLMRQPDPWRLASELIDLAEARQGLLVLNWHQQIFDENEYPGYCSMYARMIEECLKRGARFVTLSEYIGQVMAQP